MDKPERHHRPDPSRTEPIRDFMSYVRTAGFAANGRSESATPIAEVDAADPTVAHGVRLGYSVIDEQIRQGEKLAERLRHVSGRPGALPPVEVGTLIERALNVYKDMGALALAAVETLIRSPALQSAVSRAMPGGAPADPAAPAQAQAADSCNFGFELTSSRRTQIKLDIRPNAVKVMPVVHALHATNPDLPPLAGVRFQIDPATATPVLHIDVADGQPAGNYMGVVLDSATDEPCGTLSVRVLPGAA